MDKSHLILDRDTKYTAQFRRLIAESRTAVIRLPPRSRIVQELGRRLRGSSVVETQHPTESLTPTN